MTVLVPDLASFGFDLIGADRCGIRGRSGAHVLYRRRSSGSFLSVFSVARMASMRSETVEQRNGEELLVAADQPLCVVAWHDGPQTYVFSAELPSTEIIELASHVRVSGMPVLAGLGERVASALPWCATIAGRTLVACRLLKKFHPTWLFEPEGYTLSGAAVFLPAVSARVVF